MVTFAKYIRSSGRGNVTTTGSQPLSTFSKFCKVLGALKKKKPSFGFNFFKRPTSTKKERLDYGEKVIFLSCLRKLVERKEDKNILFDLFWKKNTPTYREGEEEVPPPHNYGGVQI